MKLTAAEYIHAREMQDVAKQSFTQIFKNVDLLVGAVLPVAPPTIVSQKTDMAAVTATVSAFVRFNAAQNMAGVPAMSIPCGVVAGMPVGLQIIGPHRGDARVLSLGIAFQRETDWHMRRAPSFPRRA
jgi:aspartyl-tRNA(Asn)/glutamyl-tRNA(Gln) amidotransferase subunit A